ncbi:hypothetical protein Acsp01_79280 [Actinoplanes sp. NBRC 101535]|nr:hypothetical protein Acsp01_79280 [Actinoplanes sp. NBRC 101535]
MGASGLPIMNRVEVFQSGTGSGTPCRFRNLVRGKGRRNLGCAGKVLHGSHPMESIDYSK